MARSWQDLGKIFDTAGRMCVPIDTAAVDDFDPFTVPTVSQLCQEIDTTTRPKGDERPGIITIVIIIIVVS